MQLEISDLAQTTHDVKAKLRSELPDYAGVFHDIEVDMRRQVEAIVDDREAGRSVIPEIPYADIAGGSVQPELSALIRTRGACVIRNVFDPAQARAWDDEIA